MTSTIETNVESTEGIKPSETEILNDSFVSAGEKSELDIEIEMCEELLEEESNEVECINFSPKLLTGNNEFACADNANKLLSENEVETVNNSHELPNSNILQEDDFDLEVKKCCNILKFEAPNDPDVLNTCEVKNELQVNAEVLDNKYEKDDDELSLFADTDISTLEEFEISFLDCANEISILDCANSPIIATEEKPSVKKNEDVEDGKTVSSILENEAKDINDPGWEFVKTLSTNEERYAAVRKCWKNATVPDPNKNLTYHSYRKRHFQNPKNAPKTRKRAATSNLEISKLNPAKRQRSCTFLYDKNMDSLSAEKNKKRRDLIAKMQSKVRHLNNELSQQEERLRRQCQNNGRHDYNAYGQLHNLRENFQREIESVQTQYHSMADQCSAELQYEIRELNKARDEVKNFHHFYKGFNASDPTILTTSQLQELEEIENAYLQFDQLYQR